MTTRRELLAAAGLTAMAGLLSSCKGQPVSAGPGDRLLVTHDDGLGIFDVGTREWLAKPMTATVSGGQLASVEDGQIVVRAVDTLKVSSQGSLTEAWTPRAVWRNQVALVAGAHGNAGIYRPEARTRTHLLLTRDGKEHKRFDLEGNYEPEAFSADGSRLFLLDYLPPKAPDVYRVRVMDIATGQILPLSTAAKQVVPAGAEETMRGEGRQAVHDPGRRMLYTLYTHQGDHQHTGELLGVRPNAPGVHAFIHCLNLELGWAICVDLYEPFGKTGPAGHTIALSVDGRELYAVTAEHGRVAVVDTESLKIKAYRDFMPVQGEAFALAVPQGLLVGAGRQLAKVTEAEWELGFDIRGLAWSDQLWVGREGGATAVRWSDRAQLEWVDVPGIVALRQAFTRAK